MFSDRGNRAVAQTVSNLWAQTQSEAQTAPAPSLMLNLFTDAPAPPPPRKPSGGTV